MRRGWKIFWIVSAGLVIVGFICCIIAFSMGAGFNDVVDRYHSEGSSEEFSNVDELNFDVTGKLNIKTHSQDIIRVEVIGGSSRWQVKSRQEGGELRIETRLWFNWISTSDYGTINVYVPEGYQFNEASISLGAGKAEIEDINAGELKLELGAGEGVLYNFETDELTMNCGAGRVEASGVLNGDAKIEAGVGQAALDVKGSEQDFNYDVECGIGSVRVGNNNHSGLASERKIDNGANKKIDINCGVGEINVDFY